MSGLVDDQDPYKKLPILLGSIFDKDVKASKMINVLHQAMIIWALEEINLIRTRNKPTEHLIRKYFNIIQFLMKDCKDNRQMTQQEEQDTRDEVNEMMKHFYNWRDLVIPDAFDENSQSEFLKKHKIINFP